ncbi:CRISPR system precrRNA processing endoribonuclease RAMP protein Cas6 [Thermoproteus tenax]|uniref:RAMP superfamily protein n=1 Tax=Thermoproteus tenax (strain ATCC 35583 / DSM 2078 / JCM 9277 / NBRC 100435 / Kra 1) TaxID=768679 RepID=G4RMW7_THETK|nr:CRISPR system precrRNA processing endoribonuclease RAMP protein Cas6 [Thermoproteus tenax]CCC80911.1 RAMP superfamily protein [Thermoproteus tenax Kra 1]
MIFRVALRGYALDPLALAGWTPRLVHGLLTSRGIKALSVWPPIVQGRPVWGRPVAYPPGTQVEVVYVTREPPAERPDVVALGRARVAVEDVAVRWFEPKDVGANRLVLETITPVQFAVKTKERRRAKLAFLPEPLRVFKWLVITAYKLGLVEKLDRNFLRWVYEYVDLADLRCHRPSCVVKVKYDGRRSLYGFYGTAKYVVQDDRYMDKLSYYVSLANFLGLGKSRGVGLGAVQFGGAVGDSREFHGKS